MNTCVQACIHVIMLVSTSVDTQWYADMHTLVIHTCMHTYVIRLCTATNRPTYIHAYIHVQKTGKSVTILVEKMGFKDDSQVFVDAVISVFVVGKLASSVCLL